MVIGLLKSSLGRILIGSPISLHNVALLSRFPIEDVNSQLLVNQSFLRISLWPVGQLKKVACGLLELVSALY